MFAGEYEYAIDNKGRLTIPAKLRSPEKGILIEQFMVTRGFEKCLYLFAPSEWKDISSRFNSPKMIASSKTRALQRFFYSGASMVECDRQGRILLPKNLMEYANVSSEAVVLGTGLKIEIWNPERWHEEFTRLDESYSDMAEELLMDFSGDN